MSSPLAVVSPARQNARSPLSTGEGIIMHTPKPTLDYVSTTPRSDGGYNDENVFSGKGDGSSPVFGGHANNGVEESGLSEQDGPPSSPFQTMVDIEQTSRATPAPASESETEHEVPGTVRKAYITTEASGRDVNERRLDENATSEGEGESGQLYEDAVSDRQHDDAESDESGIQHENVEKQQVFREVSTITVEDKHNETMSTVYQRGADDEMSDDDYDHNHARIGHDIMDDTCLSNFSAVPNVDMTLFSKLRADSPMKRAREGTLSPRKTQRLGRCSPVAETPGIVKKGSRASMFAQSDANAGMSPTGSPTPRKYPRGDDTTNLLDFTDQLSAISRASKAYATQNGLHSPSRRNNRLSPSRTDRFRSPNKLSLLDFDIPPAPTPRSIPTITPRELESLKSSFLSQISSLKATLSGRDAEVASLKEAVSDAERRVGEAWEELRNETAKKEALELEQGGWERRGKEMESVLRGVKSEIVEGERERERLMKRIEEAEKSKENLESRIVELENQLSAARKAKRPSTSGQAADPDSKSPDEVAKEVQDAVEKVARELHTLYKGKHETKVAALKKSYEARWEKKVREAESRLKDALEDNERLKTERDATMSGVVPGQHQQQMVGEETFLRETDQLEAEKKVLEARVKGLEQEMLSVKRDSEYLRSELKTERAEKGELVAVVDEWLAMQQYQQQQQNQQQQQQRSGEPPTPRPQQQSSYTPSDDIPTPKSNPSVERSDSSTTSTNENIPPPSTIGRAAPTPGTGSIRPRATAGPTPRVARFGMPASAHSRKNSGSGSGSGKAGPPSGLAVPTAGRSGIMSSIERMGRGGGV